MTVRFIDLDTKYQTRCDISEDFDIDHRYEHIDMQHGEASVMVSQWVS